MKRILLFLSLFFLLAASGAGADKFQVELYGGFSMLNPWDLNQRADYDHNYESFFSETRYWAYHYLLEDNFTYTGHIEGEFKKIKNAMPLGLRIKYFLNPSLSVSIGFKYLSRKQDSSVTYQHDVRSLNPDETFYYNEFSSTRENSPYRLFVKGYVPMVGIHYKIKSSRFLDFEAFLTGGPLFAECGFARQRRYWESNSYGYWYEQNVSYEMKGKGTGIAVDTGIRMNIDVVKNIDLFMECGYSFQRAVDISGPGSSETVYNELNSSGYTESTAWQGTWAVIPGRFNRPWGQWSYNFPSNEYGTDELSEFKLDLSGFQIRIGVSFRL
jgi:hypothetical protein